MPKLCKNRGFSLTEVLLSVGTLAIGMLFIAGVFPVAIHFSTVATEQTIAAVVADEAFAKIRIYAAGELDDPTDGIDLGDLYTDELKDFNDVLDLNPTVEFKSEEFAYPSDLTIDISQKKYFWSALCRLTEDTLINPNPPVQVTVFVCRKISPNLRYFNADCTDDTSRPMPVIISVKSGVEENELEIIDSDMKEFINDGYRIVDDKTGRLYRVLKRYPYPGDDIVLLDRNWVDEDWEGYTHDPDKVWVVPPPLTPGTGVGLKRCSGRNPCIAIYQKVIRF